MMMINFAFIGAFALRRQHSAQPAGCNTLGPTLDWEICCLGADGMTPGAERRVGIHGAVRFRDCVPG
jgi:hypothetical protein